MKLPKLFKKTSSGKIQEWEIEIKGNAYRTRHGQVGGKIVTTEWTTASGTNIGRANERSPQEQATFEAQSIWQKKVDSGAKESIVDVNVKKAFHTPMLAKKFEDQEGKFTYPVWSDPKLDGMRAIITKDGAFTRNGKPWLTIPHILEALSPVFAEQPDLVLDGELYNHDLKEDFNKISSLVKKTKPAPSDLEESKKLVEFWWYDCFSAEKENLSPFGIRKATMIKLAAAHVKDGGPIVIVQSSIVHNKKQLDELYGAYLDDGYEGQMVRLENSQYENKRSSSLLKRKTFSDDEYKIVEICEGNGNKSGMAGYAIMEREDGVRFRTNIKGSHSFLKDLLSNKDSVAGSYGTIKYFNLTPDGIPRFPYLIRLRDGKSTD